MQTREIQKLDCRLQRNGFLRLSALGLDLDLLQLEVARAFQAFQPQAGQARMLRRSLRRGALETWRMSGESGESGMGDGTLGDRFGRMSMDGASFWIPQVHNGSHP